MTYSIAGGNAAGLFEIDGSTGALSYKGTGEDYESGTTGYELTVRASDGSLHSDVTVTVNVTDVLESVSELAGEDLPDDTTTTGRAVVGDTVSGEVGAYFDTDWFAVDLVAGRTYVIDLRGNGTGDGSLRDPKLKGVYDSDGTWISGQRNDDGGDGLNSRLTITATETATHYIGAGAHLTGLGTYELEVTDTTGDTATVDPVDDFAAESTTTGVLVPDTDTGVALAYGDIDSGGDVDWFAIDLEANQSVVLRLTGYSPETRSYVGGIQNPQIKGVYDADGNLLSDTTTADPRAWQWFGEDSRILGFQTAGGRQWQEARLVFTATEAGTYYVAAGSLQSAQTGKYTLAVSPGPAADDFSDDTTTSGEVIVGSSVQGDIEWEDDVDWFAVELTAGVRYEFDLAGPEDSREYPVFGRYIWDGQGNPYASWRSGTDSVVDPDNTIDHGFFTPLNSGTYYIPVSGGSYDSFWFGNSTLDEYWDEALAYTLNVAEAEEQPQPPADDFTAETSTSGELEVDGEAVSGEIEVAGDVDWFAVELVADKTYVFIQRGSFRSDENTLRSPKIVGVYDSDGNPIADTGSSDQSDSFVGARIAYKATETGTHYVAVDSDGWTTANRVGTYTIEAQEIASDAVPADSTTTQTMGVRTVWFEVELEDAKSYIVKATDSDLDIQPFRLDVYNADGERLDNGGYGDSVSRTVRAPTNGGNPGGTYYIAVSTDTTNHGTEYTVVTQEVDSSTAHTTTPTIIASVDVSGLEDAPDWAANLTSRATGIIQTTDDVDWIKIELENGRTYDFSVVGEFSLHDDYPGNSGFFKFGGIHDSNGDEIDVDGSDTDSFSYQASANATYYLAVTGDTTYGLGRYWVAMQAQHVPETQSPVFAESDYVFELSENIDGSATAVELGTVSATDPQSDTLVYSIEAGNEDELFAIDSSTGALTYQGAGEDYESGTTSHSLTVQASDGTHTSDVTVAVNITDVQEQQNTPQEQQSTPQTISEPDGEDFSSDTSTAGQVVPGEVATGLIGSSGDRDWFAVDLVAGHTYVIDLRGSPTDDGTLTDPYLRGLHEADGDRISSTTNDDGGEGRNSQLTFTASESGTFYIAAGAYRSRQGTYELEVTDSTAIDNTRDGANDLGNITNLNGPRWPDASLDGEVDQVDYFTFTLTEAKKVGLGLRQQDADADLFLEDAQGSVLASSTQEGTANEWIQMTLPAGTYFIRVEAQETGDNNFKLRYGVTAADVVVSEVSSELGNFSNSIVKSEVVTDPLKENVSSDEEPMSGIFTQFSFLDDDYSEFSETYDPILSHLDSWSELFF